MTTLPVVEFMMVCVISDGRTAPVGRARLCRRRVLHLASRPRRDLCRHPAEFYIHIPSDQGIPTHPAIGFLFTNLLSLSICGRACDSLREALETCGGRSTVRTLASQPSFMSPFVRGYTCTRVTVNQEATCLRLLSSSMSLNLASLQLFIVSASQQLPASCESYRVSMVRLYKRALVIGL